MRVWYFSEMAYHPAWEEGLKRGSLRVVLPNANYDPEIGHRLLNRYLDEFRLCDEVGLDIMVNEHHSTSTCLTISVPMALAVIARETKRARLLSLGNPIANRPDPVRVAEEMAWLDVLSGGRLARTASLMLRWSASGPRARRGCAAQISRPTMFGLRWSWPRHSQPRRATTRSPPTSRCSNPAESAAALFGTATATRSTRGPP